MIFGSVLCAVFSTARHTYNKIIVGCTWRQRGRREERGREREERVDVR